MFVGQLQTGKQWHGGSQGKTCVGAAGVAVDGGVVAVFPVLYGGLGTSPVPALRGRAAQLWQACPFGRVGLDGTLLGGVGRAAHVDVVLYGMVYAAAQAPGAGYAVLCGGGQAGQEGEQKGEGCCHRAAGGEVGRGKDACGAVGARDAGGGYVWVLHVGLWLRSCGSKFVVCFALPAGEGRCRLRASRCPSPGRSRTGRRVRRC